MKSLYKAAVVTFFAISATFATQPRVGLHLGLGISGMNGDDAEDIDMGFALQAGAGINMPMMGNISVNPEILFSLRNLNYDESTTQTEMAVDVPLFIRADLAQKIFVQAGPQLNYIFRSKWDDLDVLDYRNQLELGITAGAGIWLTSQLAVDLRYHYGLLDAFDVDKSIEADASTYQLLVGATYLF